MDLCFIFTFISFYEAFLGLDLYVWLMKARKRMKKKWKLKFRFLWLSLLCWIVRANEKKRNEKIRKSSSKLKEARAKNKKKWKKKRRKYWENTKIFVVWLKKNKLGGGVARIFYLKVGSLLSLNWGMINLASLLSLPPISKFISTPFTLA